MTSSNMNETPRDPLDVALDAVPREAEPSAQLWSRIAAEIGESQAKPRKVSAVTLASDRLRGAHRWLQMAAGIVLIVASSLTTYLIMHRSLRDAVLQAQQTTVQQMQPVLNAMPASFGTYEPLGAGYLQARAVLSAEFDRRVALLPPVTRAKLERDLADLRRAANEISTTLGQHPSDPLLQQLLLSTYQSELALLDSVNNLTTPAMPGADL
jgi:hypothetical protein